MSKKQNKSDHRLHFRNKNREQYNFDRLVISNPELKKHIITTKFGSKSVDFSNPTVVKVLNTSLLNYYYGIKNWMFPEENLCPPIPGRADYIHHVADLLAEYNLGTVPRGNKISCLDIGVGASCIYPIIGAVEYGWQFIGSDIDAKSIASAQNIISSNPSINNKVKCILQKNTNDVFNGIIGQEDLFDLVVCNPPFHASIEEAQKESKRKIKNLTGEKLKTPKLNFAGISSELVCEGGEFIFIQKMIKESKVFSKKCAWFTTLLSKHSNLNGIQNSLKKAKARQIKIIPMGTSNKSTRIIGWTFLSKKELSIWGASRWK